MAAGRALLAWLLPQVTTAAPFAADTALQVAFTPSGLRGLGLPDRVMDRFSAEFREGMASPNRSRFLGDVAESDPLRWAWGKPQGPPIDCLTLLYAASPDILERRQADLKGRLAELGVSEVTELGTLELANQEPFGFRDGISQPIIAGLPKATGNQRTVPAGEFVLGYPNARGQLTDRPMLPSADDPRRLLLPDPAGTGQVDLGRNGTYLVLRQLEQDVDAFRRYLGQATRRPDGTEDPGEQAALAAKMVGRWPSGAPLISAPCRDDRALGGSNDFGYHGDPLGLACPLGAHIRRANPRDSLDPQPAASLDASDLHRILRRGRSYGQAGTGRRETGLYFICLGGNLSRQFEFVQHTWLNNPPAGRRNLHGSGAPGPPPVPRPAAVRADAGRGLLLPSRRLGLALPGAAERNRASGVCGGVTVGMRTVSAAMARPLCWWAAITCRAERTTVAGHSRPCRERMRG